MVDTRALLPNGNDPATVPPATVGPPAAVPGDPDGFVLEVQPATGAPRTGWPPPAAPWSGWPEDWPVFWSNWLARLDQLSDIAWACLDLNASVLSTMPAYLVSAAPSLDTAWLLNPDPDLYADWSEFAKSLAWDYQGNGEAFIVCTSRYASGWPARFHVVDPWLIDVELDGDGLRRYTIGGLEVPRHDVLHLRYTSRTSDAHGHGPLEVGAGRCIAANVLARYASNLASAGGIPSSIITHPGELTAERSNDLRNQWIEARMAALGMPAVLSGGVTWQATQLNPRDMALLDLAQWNEARVAILLRVPPYMVGLPSGGDPMTYTNANGIYDYHWRGGLLPIADQLMRRLSAWALPSTTRVELNRDAYVQAEPVVRAQGYATLAGIVQDGRPAITVEEIRLAERLDTPANLAEPGVLR